MSNKITYREDQIPIMKYRGGTMAVPAVPGAGKTFIISNLVGDIISEKIHKPGKVLVVTFMNSAVNNFKNRIGKILDKKGIQSASDYEVMTIHSLALKIIKDRPDVIGVNEEFNILDDINKVMYLQEAILQWRKEGGERIFSFLLNDYGKSKYSEKQEAYWSDFLRSTDAIIGELKLNDITPEKLKSEIYKLGTQNILQFIQPIYKIYQAKLNSQGYIDYNDILIYAYKLLLSDEKLRAKFQKRYSFIFEDECQDSNLIQGRILGVISQKSGNLVRVGDINQSITGTFTSSNPMFFKEFSYEAEKKFEMNMAGRSSREIIDLANYLVETTRENHPEFRCREALSEQYIRPHNKDFIVQNPLVDTYGIRAFQYSSEEEEFSRTARLVYEFKKKNPNKTCGVLVSYNSMVWEMANKIKATGIECEELSSSSVKRLEIAEILGRILDFGNEPFSRDKFVSLVETMIKENKNEKELLVRVIEKHKVEDILYPLKENAFESITQEILNYDISEEFNSIVLNLREIYSFNSNDLPSFILNIGNILDLSIEDKAMVEAVANYATFKRKNTPKFSMEDLSYELLKENNSMLNHISSLIYEMEGYEPSTEKVTVATLHKSKGLEWDCVFLLNNTAYNYPCSSNDKFRESRYFKDNYKNLISLGKGEIKYLINEEEGEDPIEESKIEIINEKIRLLYVGITRAKEYLMIMSNKSNVGKWNESKPSYYFYKIHEFINERRGER